MDWYLKIIVLKLCEFATKLYIFPNFFRQFVAAYYYGEGMRAFNKKLFTDSFKILKPIADYEIDSVYVGSAQYIIGTQYLYGLGTNRDLLRAEHYLREATKRGSEEAEQCLSLKK